MKKFLLLIFLCLSAGLFAQDIPEQVIASSFGYKADDATEALQAAFDSGAKTVIVDNPGTPWIIRPVFLKSNQHIILKKGTVIQAKKDEYKVLQDCLFTIDHQKNIILEGEEGATLQMHKKDYQNRKLYKGGQWRHTLSLVSAHNIIVKNLTIRSSGGDGIYIGQGKYQKGWEPQASHDILVENCIIDDHHRQGISVIVASKLTLRNCTISGTKGTEPEAGIDFENSDKTQYFQEILVEKCKFIKNNWCGVNFSCLCIKPMDVTIRDCYFEGNVRQPLVFSGRPKVPNTGLVTIEKCTFANVNREAVNFSNFNAATSYKVLLKDCKIIGSKIANAGRLSPIAFNISDARYRHVGNVSIENLIVDGYGKNNLVQLFSRLCDVAIDNVTGTANMNGQAIDVAAQIASDKTTSIPEYKPPQFKNYSAGKGEKRLGSSMQNRRDVEVVIYGSKGEKKSFTIRHKYLYKTPPSAIRKPGYQWQYVMTSPSGTAIPLEPFGVIPDTPGNEKRFTVELPETGLYTLLLTSPSDAVLTEFVPNDASLCWGERSTAKNEGLLTYRVQPGVTEYTTYNGVFEVPTGTDRFSFETNVKDICLTDASGKIVLDEKNGDGLRSYEFIAPYPGVWHFAFKRMMSTIEIRLSSDVPGILSVAPGNLPRAEK